MIPSWLTLDLLSKEPNRALNEALSVFSRMSRYSEIYGDIVIREHHFLPSSKLRQLMAATSFSDGVKLLEDSKYAFLSKASTMDEAEELMRSDLIDEINHAPLDSFGKSRMSYFYKYWDYENLKIALKSHVMGLVPELGMSFHGKQIFKMVAGEGVAPLKGTSLYRVAKGALYKYEKSKDPLDIDLYIDRVYFARAPLSLRNVVRKWIDVENAKMFYRVKGDERLFKRAYLPGGYISERRFMEGVHEKLFDKELSASSPSLREWLLDLRLLDYIYEDGVYNPMSFEFTFSYFVRRLYEVRMLDFLLSTRGYILPDISEYVRAYEQVMRL